MIAVVGAGSARKVSGGGSGCCGVERRGRPHAVWLPQWMVVAAAATGEEEEVVRRRWFEFVRESPCERMGQRVAEVGTGYGKASDGRRPGGQGSCCGTGLHQGPSGGFVCTRGAVCLWPVSSLPTGA